MTEDREEVIDGVSYHERWEDEWLLFRYPNLFEPEKHKDWPLIKRLIRPKTDLSRRSPLY